jgi:hypothetical protein
MRQDNFGKLLQETHSHQFLLHIYTCQPQPLKTVYEHRLKLTLYAAYLTILFMIIFFRFLL